MQQKTWNRFGSKRSSEERLGGYAMYGRPLNKEKEKTTVVFVKKNIQPSLPTMS